jgi:hypothetical protein
MPRNTVEPETPTSKARPSLAHLVVTSRPNPGLLRPGRRILRSDFQCPLRALGGGLAIDAALTGAGISSGVATSWSKMLGDLIVTDWTLGQVRG